MTVHEMPRLRGRNHATAATHWRPTERHSHTAHLVHERQFNSLLWSCLQHRLPAGATIQLAKNSNLYNAGEQGNALYFIERGLLKTSTYSRCGKACLLNVYTGGDVVGESALLDQPRTETATAMLPTVLRRIPRDHFLQMLADEATAKEWLRYLTSRLSEQQEVITLLVTVDSKQRLAVTLLRLANKLGRRHGSTLQIGQRITHEEFAEMVGTTRSRVGLFLKQFRTAGLIDIGTNSALVIDERRLRSYVEARS